MSRYNYLYGNTGTESKYNYLYGTQVQSPGTIISLWLQTAAWEGGVTGSQGFLANGSLSMVTGQEITGSLSGML